jgi:hypothetical protein
MAIGYACRIAAAADSGPRSLPSLATCWLGLAYVGWLQQRQILSITACRLSFSRGQATMR